MFPTDIVVPKGIFSIEKRSAHLSPIVTLSDTERAKKWLKEIHNRAEKELRSESMSTKLPGYPLRWFWKTIEHFGERLPKKPLAVWDARSTLAKDKWFSSTAFDRAIKVLFKLS